QENQAYHRNREASEEPALPRVQSRRYRQTEIARARTALPPMRSKIPRRRATTRSVYSPRSRGIPPFNDSWIAAPATSKQQRRPPRRRKSRRAASMLNQARNH